MILKKYNGNSHAFKELKTYIALNAGVFLKPLQFISCGYLLWENKITDFLTQMAQAQNV